MIPVKSSEGVPANTVLFINTKMSPDDLRDTRDMSLEQLAEWMVNNRRVAIAVNVGLPKK